METVLITGGCGFIGSHLAERIVQSGYRVKVFDNLSTGHTENIEHLKPMPELIEGDVRDFGQVERVTQGVNRVFHLAALVSVAESVERPVLCHDVNVTGALNVLEACRVHHVKRMILASSAAVYGSEPTLPKSEEMLPAPESPYAASKLTGEMYARLYARLYGVETVSLRFFNVYGPRQDPSSMYSGVISRFTRQMLTNETLTIFGDGRQTRDFVFVKDVVQAAVLAMISTELGRGEVMNIASGASISLLSLLEALESLTGRKVVPSFAEERIGDVRYSEASVARMLNLLGFRAVHSIRSGLESLLSYESSRISGA
ncbi:MAG: SDR family NAD(P)-dependent oxidoreductase [Deltaproteobacteria bacterium]|nr:SDR family NAD(P)-dependent oxidoreductase [Deltaproteobacteria bacterium]